MYQTMLNRMTYVLWVYLFMFVKLGRANDRLMDNK